MILTEQAFRDILTGDNAEARDPFLKRFGRRINGIAHAAHVSYRSIDRIGRWAQETDRSRRVFLFMHSGLNSVVSSVNLLVNGYPLPAMHLMRHFGEACAMAILCFDPQSGVFEELERLGSQYPTHKALDRVARRSSASRLRTLLGLDTRKWHEFRELTAFYDKFSHASHLAMGFHIKFTQPQLLIVGSEFDPQKARQLSIELRRRRTALRSLSNVARALARALPQRRRRLRRAV